MLDIKFIRENKDIIKEGARKKHLQVDVDKLLGLDDKRIALSQEIDAFRAEQNRASEEIAKKSGGRSLLEKMKILKTDLQAKDAELKTVMKEWQSLMLAVPNVPDVSVPDGKDDTENVEVKKVGAPPKFSFAPKSHIELLKDLGMADFERGVKLSGFRGYVLKGDGALLSFALWQFVIDFFKVRGYEFMLVPSLVNQEAFLGTGYLPQGEEDLYKTQDGTYFAGTAEVPVMAYFMGDVLKKEDLPKKIIAFSPCFRREAGSYGKDTKGLMRVHEFYKWEQVVLSEASHEESVKYHEEITKNAEDLMQGLGIPYRVVLNCAGDLGLGQVKKYDIEAWVPSEGAYRETHSSSYFHDFQTRRLNIKYRDEGGKTKFAHSLNSTALATPRPFAALLENYQTADGSVKIPDALRKYFGKDTIRP